MDAVIVLFRTLLVVMLVAAPLVGRRAEAAADPTPPAAPAPAAAYAPTARAAAPDATAVPPAARVPSPAEIDADLAGVRRDATTGGVVFDALVLRPLSFIQLAFSAVVFVPAYPVSLLFGGSDDVMRACISEPAHQTFGRPLGQR